MNKVVFFILWVVGLAATIFGVVILINTATFDEDLVPEIVTIKNIQAKPFSDEDALPALYAIHGSLDQDFQALTEKFRHALNQEIKQTGLDFLSFDVFETLAEIDQYLPWPEGYPDCRIRNDSQCMSKLFNALKQKPLTDATYLALLSRYQALTQKTVFSDQTQLNFDSPFTPFSLPIRLQKLYLATEYIEQDPDLFFITALKDFNFWRMVLKESHLLITKMVAVTAMRHDIAIISEGVKQGRLNAALLLKDKHQMLPLNQDEMNMERTFEYEFKYSMDLVYAIEDEPEYAVGFFDFFQPKATLNLNYDVMTRPAKKLAAFDSLELFNYIKQAKSGVVDDQLSLWQPRNWYNFVGKSLIKVAAPNYFDYFGRVHDTNGMIHLLNLQMELAKHPELPAEQVIFQSKWVNPYTMNPMSYDALKQRIYFECLDESSVCELYL